MNEVHPLFVDALSRIKTYHRRAHTVDVELEYGLVFECEYDYQPAEKPVYDVESPVCGPGCDASMEVTAAWIKGDPERRDVWPLLPASAQEQLAEGAYMQVVDP